MSLIRLYLDEDVNPLLADHLRDRGFDAISALEAGRRGHSDHDQLVFATQHGRCLLTHNRDHFLALARTWAQRGTPHRGILIAPQRPVRQLLHGVLHAVTLYSAEDVENVVLWV